MPTIKKFEDLEIWTRARNYNVKILPFLKALEDNRPFALKNQLDDSAGSVMDNIAEGFEREGNREFLQFLSIAKGSLGESRSQCYRVLDRQLIDEKEFPLLQSDGLLLCG